MAKKLKYTSLDSRFRGRSLRRFFMRKKKREYFKLIFFSFLILSLSGYGLKAFSTDQTTPQTKKKERVPWFRVSTSKKQKKLRPKRRSLEEALLKQNRDNRPYSEPHIPYPEEEVQETKSSENSPAEESLIFPHLSHDYPSFVEEKQESRTQLLEKDWFHLKDYQVVDERGRNLLHEAVLGGLPLKVIKHLKNQNVDIHAKDKEGRTPLHLSAQFNHVPEVLETLLRAKANIHAKDTEGRTPLYLAVLKNPSVRIVHALLRSRSGVHFVDKNGQNLLHISSSHHLLSSITQALIEAGAHVYARDSEGRTPLHHAAESNPYPKNIILALVSAGANPNASDLKGKTPLHYAIEKNNASAVLTLISTGAKRHIKDLQHLTPMDYASENLNPEIIKALGEDFLTIPEINFSPTGFLKRGKEKKGPTFLQRWGTACQKAFSTND